ncbi:hypothetical protein AMA2_12 [Achromobacter phage AMA2]|nr:hypothetical protein AMA2_12 [Achromobacter phage AMA2]
MLNYIAWAKTDRPAVTPCWCTASGSRSIMNPYCERSKRSCRV